MEKGLQKQADAGQQPTDDAAGYFRCRLKFGSKSGTSASPARLAEGYLLGPATPSLGVSIGVTRGGDREEVAGIGGGGEGVG